MQLVLVVIMLIASVIPTLYIAEAREQYRDYAPVQILQSVQYEQTKTPARSPLRNTSKVKNQETTPVENEQNETGTSHNNVDTHPLSTTPQAHTTVAAPTKREVTITTPKIVTPITTATKTTEGIAQSMDSIPDGYGTFLQELATEIHHLTNKKRQQSGLSQLTYSSALTAIADAHSTDMAAQDYFEHTSPLGCTLTCRFTQANYAANTWGENIAWIHGDPLPSAKDLAASFFDSWMESDGHRKNILSNKFTHEGIGVTRTGTTVYATVNFAKPR